VLQVVLSLARYPSPGPSREASVDRVLDVSRLAEGATRNDRLHTNMARSVAGLEMAK
jgi:hypothetical protein